MLEVFVDKPSHLQPFGISFQVTDTAQISKESVEKKVSIIR
jgi:hypothetical protein